jgi:hypothetical protein
MTNYPLNLPAGQPGVVVESRGSFVYYESGSAGGADSSIKVQMPGSGGGELILKVGQGFKLNTDFDRLVISNNLAQGNILGNLVIADGTFSDHRVVGTVEVIDGGKNRTLSGAAFIIAMYQGPVAAQYSAVQLFNPATSKKNTVIEKMYVSSATAQFLKIGSNMVANAAPAGNAPAKKIGGAQSLAQYIVSSAVGAPAGFAFLVQIQVQASQALVIEFREPIILPPGYGLNVIGGAVNTDVNASIEFYEDGV